MIFSAGSCGMFAAMDPSSQSLTIVILRVLFTLWSASVRDQAASSAASMPPKKPPPVAATLTSNPSEPAATRGAQNDRHPGPAGAPPRTAPHRTVDVRMNTFHGNIEARLDDERLRRNITECWERQGPDAEGKAFFALLIGESQAPVDVFLLHSLGLGLDQCLENSLQAQVRDRGVTRTVGAALLQIEFNVR